MPAEQPDHPIAPQVKSPSIPSPCTSPPPELGTLPEPAREPPGTAETLPSAEPPPVETTHPGVPENTPQGTLAQSQQQVARAMARSGGAVPTLVAIPGYELVGELGRGGMGVVYKARQLSLNRLVALKMILAAGSENSPAVIRFLTEAEVVAAIRHPNVVQVYDYGESDGRPFMALEYLSGGTLGDQLKGGLRLAPMEAASLVERIARGVQAAHGHGIVHRDLKPANVLFDEAREPKVSDFGLAKRASSELTQTGAVMGTPAYMAPEQAGGRTHDIGPPADVWALGVILYECLSGTRPFEAERVDELLAKVLLSEPEPLRSRTSEIPRDLDTICRKCLAKEPHERYASALALAQDLERFQAGEPILAKPEGAIRKVWRRVRHRSLAIVTLSALALTVVIAAALIARSSSQHRRLSDLTQRLDEGLDEAVWPDGHREALLALADDLAVDDPTRADAARKKVTERVARRFREQLSRPRIDSADISRLEAEAAWVLARDAELGAALGRELGNRLRTWSPILDLTPPFANASEVFSPGVVSPAADRLTRVESGPAATPTRTPSRGPIRAEVEFAAGWEDSMALGLVVHRPTAPGSDLSRGYTFRVAAAPPRPEDGTPLAAPSPRTFRESGGTARAEIARNGIVLSSRLVHLSPGSPLHFAVERSGDALRLRVNDLAPLEFADPIPLVADADAVLGLLWPGGVAITRLRADTLMLPPTPSPLERADHLYDTGKLTEAVAVYLDQVRTTPDSAVATEAQCKAGMALLGLNRADEAVPLLEQVLLRPGDRWPVIAGCQLWFLRVREKQFEEAETILNGLSGRFTREQIARYVPAELRRALRVGGEALNVKVNLLFPDPRLIPQLEGAVKLAELMAEDDVRDGMLTQLMIALFLNRENSRAAELGQKWLRRATGHYERGFIWAVRWYGWELRQLGLHGRAREEFEHLALRQAELLSDAKSAEHRHELLQGLLAIKLEEARLFADAGKWQQAEEALDYYLKSMPRPVGNYNHFSAASPMKGFCRLEQGDAEGARRAWAAGRFQAFKEQWPVGRRPAEVVPPGGTGLLDGWMLASLSNELSDEDAKQYWAALAGMISTDPVAAQLAEAFAMSPAVVRAAWQSPRAQELARKMAFLQLHPVEQVRLPLLVLVYEKFRQDLFGGKPPAAVDEVLWQTVDRFGNRFLDGKISKAQILQAAFAWKGTSGVFGWASLSPTLTPEIRGPTAYTLGLRYVKIGKPPDAMKLFRTAVADAPPDSPLARLAAEEIAKLDGKPSAVSGLDFRVE